MANGLKKFWHCERCLSLALIATVAILTYAPLFGKLGYYIEDWYEIWTYVTQGAWSLIPLYLTDRPLRGYSDGFFFTILGTSALNWQIYALILRILGAFALLWLLRMLWPNKKLETTAAAVLFVVYPGFIQQPQAIAFQAQLLALALVLFSIDLSLYCLQVHQWLPAAGLTGLALLMMLAYPLLMEYYVGLEALRVAALWVAIRKQSQLSLKESLLRTLKRWLPYLAALGLYLFWRVFIFSGSRPTTNLGRLVSQYASNLTHMSAGFFVELAKDFLETIYLAWSVPLNNFLYSGTYRDNLFVLVFAILAVAGLLLFYKFGLERLTSQADSSPEGSQDYKSFFWVGILTVLAGLIPVIAANRDVQFVQREDRFSLPASIGVVLLVSSFIFYVFPKKLRFWAIFFLLGVSALTQLNYAIYMRDFWDVEKDVWWQLSWRAPEIKEGTLLLVHLPDGFSFSEGYEAWGPANLIYHREAGPPRITAEVLYSATLPQVFRGGEDPLYHRGILVDRNFDNTLVLSMATRQSCLNVIDGEKYELSKDEDPIVQLVAPYSKIAAVQAGEQFTQPPEELFGPEPQHGWCYFYQKAMYARQVGDWQAIADLGDEARQKGLGPVDRSEWMPFLEGYASLNRDKDARNIAAIIKSEIGPRNLICKQLNASPNYPAGYAYEKVVEYLCGSK
jgi:hypothetical protein